MRDPAYDHAKAQEWAARQQRTADFRKHHPEWFEPAEPAPQAPTTPEAPQEDPAA